MKYILFDMDGVLINTEPLHYKVWVQIMKEHGIDMSYEVYKGCIGSTRLYLYGLIKEAYGVDLYNDETIPKRFDEIKRDIIEKNGIPQIDGVVDTINYLYDKGYKMAVASSSSQKYIEKQMESLGIKDCFQVLCSGEHVENPKPAPDVFLKAAELIGAKPDECIVVEDSSNGTRAAKAAGMYCIGFKNPDSGVQDLSLADKIIYDIKELKQTFNIKC